LPVSILVVEFMSRFSLEYWQPATGRVFQGLKGGGMRVCSPSRRWSALAASVFVLAAPALSNQVEGVKPFPRDLDSGSMALHALASCLDAIGASVSYNRLISLSGSGFKFVYDTTEAYEPLRDLFPTDVFKTSARAVGFPDAHWELDLPMQAVKEIVKREIDAGRGVVAPFLKNDAYHGFFVITGYDFGRGVFKLQGALTDTAYTEVPIPASWTGPTASPLGWAANPVFVIGDRDPGQVFDDLDKRMVDLWMEMLRGGELTYGLTPGEQPYLASPGPHTARYGIPAYKLLSVDVATRPLVVKREGAGAVDFGFLWRLDSQLGQLQQDRKYAAIALDLLSSRVSNGKSTEVLAIADNVEKTSGDARDLREMLWQLIPPQINTADAVVKYVQADKSMVFSVAGREGLLEDLQSLGLKAFRSPWGPVVVDDSPAKRLQARLLVKSLEARDRVSLRTLGEIAAYVGPDLGAPGQETPKIRQRKK
jgi:hypothetical protein